MDKEIFIDDDSNTVIVGKPSFKYEVTHTETNLEIGTNKTWVKKIG